MTIPVVDAMPALDPLLASHIPEVKNAAEQAAKLAELLKTDEISKSEFDELIDDIVHIEKIKKDMFDLEVYMDIQKAFKIILTLKSIATLI